MFTIAPTRALKALSPRLTWVNPVLFLPLMMGTISSSLSQRTRKWRATLHERYQRGKRRAVTRGDRRAGTKPRPWIKPTLIIGQAGHTGVCMQSVHGCGARLRVGPRRARKWREKTAPAPTWVIESCMCACVCWSELG